MKLTVVGNNAHAHIVDGEPRKSYVITLRGEPSGGLPPAALDFSTLDAELAKKYSGGATVEITLGEPVPAPVRKPAPPVEDAEDTDE